MRTLNADLTTAQKDSSGTPYITADLYSINGDVQENYTTIDSPNRIVSVRQAEGTSNGHINVAGTGRAISLILRIRDADGAKGATNHTGSKVDIGWGFNTSSGNRVSKGPPGFVYRQRRISLEGEKFVEYLCVSPWDLLSSTFHSISTTGLIKFKADKTIRHILLDLMGGATPAAVVQQDASVYTSFTTEAGNDTADNVILLSATPQINDAVYYGRATLAFDTLTHDLTDVGTGQIIVWEYWNGSAWTSLSNVVDGNNSFKTGELKIVNWTLPTIIYSYLSKCSPSSS